MTRIYWLCTANHDHCPFEHEYMAGSENPYRQYKTEP